MSKVYDTYGFKSRDIEGIAADLGLLLERLFISRRDETMGRVYSTGHPDGEEFELLYNNGTYTTDDWLEPNHQAYQTILYVHRTERADEIKESIDMMFRDDETDEPLYVLIRRDVVEQLAE